MNTNPAISPPLLELPVERLPFSMPRFRRVSWVTDNARAIWQPRFERVAFALRELRWRSTRELETAAVLWLDAPEMLRLSERVAKAGLSLCPIDHSGERFRVVVGSPAKVKAWMNARRKGRHEQALVEGMPACCSTRRDTLIEHDLHDPTWFFAAREQASEVQRPGNPLTSIMLRRLELALPSHEPCDLECAKTLQRSERLRDIGRHEGFEEELARLEEILSWPIEWSALHGIAEVRTPLFRMAHDTDATASKLVVRLDGEGFPAEGVRGLSHAYLSEGGRVLESRGYRSGLLHVIDEVEPSPAWWHTDNGFSSSFEMGSAHRPIVNLVLKILGEGGGNVLDIGCGNGALLEKIVDGAPGVVPYGVELDPERIAHWKQVHAKSQGGCWCGDIRELDDVWDKTYEVAIVMPGRLLEAEPEASARLLDRLARQCQTIVAYAYPDWLATHGSLQRLAHKAGLELLTLDPHAKVSVARVRRKAPT